jgi:Amiloride-sensitive sodium channel
MVQSLTFFDFMSNVGGFMGLLAGISVLSIIEVFYHIVHHFRPKLTAIQPIMNFSFETRQIPWVNENHAIVQMSKYCGEYIRSSDIHGLQYTRDNKQSRCGKIFWIILVVLSFFSCLILVQNTYKNAEKSPVATSIDPETLNSNDVRKF